MSRFGQLLSRAIETRVRERAKYALCGEEIRQQVDQRVEAMANLLAAWTDPGAMPPADLNQRLRIEGRVAPCVPIVPPPPPPSIQVAHIIMSLFPKYADGSGPILPGMRVYWESNDPDTTTLGAVIDSIHTRRFAEPGIHWWDRSGCSRRIPNPLSTRFYPTREALEAARKETP